MSKYEDIDRFERYVDCLKRIPNDVVLAVASRDIVVSNGHLCVCGWALREGLARLPKYANKSAEEIELLRDYVWDYKTVPERCQQIFGGYVSYWESLYFDAAVPGRTQDVELAFLLRVAGIK